MNGAPRLSEIIAQLNAKAGEHGRAQITLSKGLAVVVDRRHELHAVRFGRLAPAWPSGDEIAICRRNGIEYPNTANTERKTSNGWNVVEYTFQPISPGEITQPPLPELAPLVQVKRIPDESLDARFNRWLEANPQVMQAFLHYAVEAYRRGCRHIGGKLIVEQLRWQSAIQTAGDPYKLDNSMTSRLVRAAIDRQPELASVFETRELRS